MKVSFAGIGIESKEVEDDRNPVFDQQLRIPIILPCMNRKIRWEIWDADWGRDERTGTFIAQFPTKEKDRVKQEAKWANMYGPAFGVSGEKADYMTKFSDSGKIYLIFQIGTHYAGRVLYSLDFENK